MSRQVSPSANWPYGVLRVTRAWGTSRATVYRHRRCDAPTAPAWPAGTDAGRGAGRGDPQATDREPVPRRGLPEDLGPAALRWHSHLQAPRLAPDPRAWSPGAAAGRPAAWPEGPRRHHPNGAGRREVGHRSDLDPDRRGAGVDLRDGGSLLDGMHGHPRGAPRHALRGARAAPSGRRTCLGAFAEGITRGLRVRHDHGSQFVADDYQRERAFLGIASSPAFVREAEGNGCSSASSGRSRRTCCGCGASPPSRCCAWRCWSSSAPTTRPGSSSATATARPPKSVPTSSAWPRSHDASAVSHKRRPLHSFEASAKVA
jgi:putative transposase